MACQSIGYDFTCFTYFKDIMQSQSATLNYANDNQQTDSEKINYSTYRRFIIKSHNR